LALVNAGDGDGDGDMGFSGQGGDVLLSMTIVPGLSGRLTRELTPRLRASAEGCREQETL
jgi:hypothetical protein